MKALEWIDGGAYRIPAKTTCGSYQVWATVGGSRGAVYRAHHFIGVGIQTPIGEPRDTLLEAKADAQAHQEDLHRQVAAAAKDPTAG